MLRLKRMEHGSEQRVRAVTGQIARLREEGRLARESDPPQKVRALLLFPPPPARQVLWNGGPPL